MDKLMAEVDQRTRLAGANKMELLMFHLGTDETYGINVFKIREVMKLPSVTKIPDSDPRILGLVHLRGENIPVVDLKQCLGLGPLERERAKLVITEFNNLKQGFLVEGVDRIIRMSWERIRVPPPMIRFKGQGTVTAVTMLDDSRMVLILDVEKILTDIAEKPDEEIYKGLEATSLTRGKHVLVADDSMVARKQITKTLERLGMTFEEASTGKEALERVRALADRAQELGKEFTQMVQVILTDIEMPEMDGFTFTKLVRADPRTGSIPILMHSSLSGNCNIEKGKSVGVTDYVTKFDARHLQEVILKVFGQSSTESKQGGT